MNQYTVTFTIPMAESYDDVYDWAYEVIGNPRSFEGIGITDITKLDPETHYGAVLAEAQKPKRAYRGEAERTEERDRRHSAEQARWLAEEERRDKAQNDQIKCPKCGTDTGHYDLRGQVELERFDPYSPVFVSTDERSHEVHDVGRRERFGEPHPLVYIVNEDHSAVQ